MTLAAKQAHVAMMLNTARTLYRMGDIPGARNAFAAAKRMEAAIAA